MSAELLEMRGIDKRFPGVQALWGVDFDVRPGEVHALMGENGAGKSTLLKVLGGVHRADAGGIALGGQPFRARSPADAQRRGIACVFQEVHLIPGLSVAENVFLGDPPRRWYGVDRGQMRRAAQGLLAEFDLRVDVDRPAGALPAAVQQLVAIARAIRTDARLLILDEPTASLDLNETQRLFGVARGLAARGLGIVFVTHFLDQVYEISDRITVLRQGRRVGTFATRELPRLALVAHMLGHAPEPSARAAASAFTCDSESEAPAVLCARGLGRRGQIAPFDLTVRRGEVLGLAGLLGAGRTETARLLAGADRADAGSMEVSGRSVSVRSPRQAIANGIGLCPEERRVDGLVPAMSVRDNIALVVQRTLSRIGVTSGAEHARIAERLVRRLGIALASLEQPVWQLSGGNQQKVILARWLACRLRVLILDEPTRGIDIGAKAQIESLIDELAGEGLAVVFISSELDEVVRRCDRIRVLRDRRHIADLAGGAIEAHAVMRAIAGDATHGD